MGNGLKNANINGVNGVRSDRGKDGRFLKGHPGGPGNPTFKRMLAYREAVAKAATPEKVEEATLKLIEVALSGDVPAIKLLLEYTCGKPKQEVELSGEVAGMTADERFARLVGFLERRRASGTGQPTNGHTTNGNGTLSDNGTNGA